MRKLLGLIGMTVGSYLGWWAGAHVGTMSAFVASMVGTGAGLWAGWRGAEHLGG